MTVRDHSRLLAGFFFIKGALIGLSWLFMGGWMGSGLFLLLFAAFFMVTGWKLENQKPDARIMGIVASILALFSFPLGTALGIYGLWFFFMRTQNES